MKWVLVVIQVEIYDIHEQLWGKSVLKNFMGVARITVAFKTMGLDKIT